MFSLPNRNIAVEYKRSLVAIDHTKKEATFQKLETEDLETETVKVSLKQLGQINAILSFFE